MSAPAPMPMRWSGEGFEPLARFRRLADASFVVGQVYNIEVLEERSAASHRHYFAALNEAWQNLRENAAERFPTMDHLRAFALIRPGYADSVSIVAASIAEAQRIAGFIRPMDSLSVVTVEGCTVTRWSAKSQSCRAMGKIAFEASKRDVLDFVAGMVGVTAPELARETEAA